MEPKTIDKKGERGDKKNNERLAFLHEPTRRFWTMNNENIWSIGVG